MNSPVGVGGPVVGEELALSSVKLSSSRFKSAKIRKSTWSISSCSSSEDSLAVMSHDLGGPSRTVVFACAFSTSGLRCEVTAGGGRRRFPVRSALGMNVK